MMIQYIFPQILSLVVTLYTFCVGGAKHLVECREMCQT